MTGEPRVRDLNSPASLLFYRFARVMVVLFSMRPWRVKVIGAENIPLSGPVILAPSHRSMLDITWTSGITHRRIRFMGKDTLFRVPVLGWCFTALGGFAVARDGTDRGPLRDSLAILANGEVLTLYPEGTRQRGPAIQALQPGAAWIAIKAGVPIIPIAIAGSEEPFRSGRRVPRFGRGVILIGAPMHPPQKTGGVVKRALVNEFSDELHGELQSLFDRAYDIRGRR